MYSRSWNTISQLQSVACHMGSHSVTYPTQVNTPRLHPSQTGWYSIYLPRRDGRLSWPRVVSPLYLQYFMLKMFDYTQVQMYYGPGTGPRCCIWVGQMLHVHSPDGSTSAWNDVIAGLPHTYTRGDARGVSPWPIAFLASNILPAPLLPILPLSVNHNCLSQMLLIRPAPTVNSVSYTHLTLPTKRIV